MSFQTGRNCCINSVDCGPYVILLEENPGGNSFAAEKWKITFSLPSVKLLKFLSESWELTRTLNPSYQFTIILEVQDGLVFFTS